MRDEWHVCGVAFLCCAVFCCSVCGILHCDSSVTCEFHVVPMAECVL